MRLLAFARMELRLGESEFLAMAPKMFSALLRAWDEKQQIEWLRVGVVISAISGLFGVKVKASDYVPRKREPQGIEEAARVLGGM